jgi:hypothetical protein
MDFRFFKVKYYMDIKQICDIKSCNDGDRPGWASLQWPMAPLQNLWTLYISMFFLPKT